MRFSSRLLVGVLLVPLALACQSCAREGVDVEGATFTALGMDATSSRSRPATDEEIRRFEEAYRAADRIEDVYETTAPARIDAELSSGGTLVVLGGSEDYQTVITDADQYCVKGEELGRLLEEIASQGMTP